MSTSHSARTAARRTATVAALLASAVAMPAFAQSVGSVANPGFESGDTSGWTTCGGYWSSGNFPVPESECNGPANLATIMSGGNDPITGVPTVFAGNHSLRLNNSSGGNDITGLSQTVTNYSGNKLYYAWNAVLEPSHGANDSPSFIIKVVDQTTNTVVTNIAYSAYSAQNSTIFRQAGYFVTTDWKVEDIDTTNGHDYRLVFIAVDCYYGGHAGYVYVDGFGNVIPTNNAGVSFDPATDVVKGASFLIPVGGTPDIDTAKPFYTTTELLGNLVNPNFVGGTLQADGVGPIAANFTVQSQGGTIDTNGNDIAFTGQFTGAGLLTKIGLGKLTLSGINTIDGGVVVNAGTLNVMAALSTLGVTVNNGATLSGVGPIIGNVVINSGGTLAPGDRIGTMQVAAGNVTLNTGSNFALDIDGRTYVSTGGAGTYDRLAMSLGSAFTAGGTLRPSLRGITGGNNNFTPVLGDVFTVVTADAVNGQFASVAQPTTGLAANTRFDVLYNPKNVQLVVTPGSFATLGTSNGWKLNAIAAGAGLDAVRPSAGTRAGNMQALYNDLYGMNATQYQAAFNGLSGEIYAHGLLAANTNARDTASLVTDAASTMTGCEDGDNTRNADGSKRAGCDDGRNHMAIWTKLFGQHTNADESASTYGFKSNRYGFVSGLNLLNTAAVRAGIGGGFAETVVEDTTGADTRLREGSLFGYASGDLGPVNLSAMLGWTSTTANTKRPVPLLSGIKVANGQHKLETVYGNVEARVDIPVGSSAVIRPVAGLQFARTTAKALTESNNAPTIALSLPEETWSTAHTKLGAEAEFGLGGKVQGAVFGAWRHQIDGDPAALRTIGLGNASWTVASDGASDDSYEFGAALKAQLAPKAQLRLEYRGVRDGEVSSDRGTVGVAFAF